MKKTLLLIVVLTLTMAARAQTLRPMPPRMPDSPDGMAPMPPVRGFGGNWWKNSELAEKLKLTDQQKQQLEQTFLDYRLKLVDLHADVERQELRLQPLMDADQVNEGQISSQLDALVAARGKLEKTNAMMNVAMRKVLTVDQWKQLRTLREERFRRPGGHGEHGPEDRMRRGDQPPPPPAVEPAKPGSPPGPSVDQM
jgi:Spy/CpxP family protein refolding chaperone